MVGWKSKSTKPNQIRCLHRSSEWKFPLSMQLTRLFLLIHELKIWGVFSIERQKNQLNQPKNGWSSLTEHDLSFIVQFWLNVPQKVSQSLTTHLGPKFGSNFWANKFYRRPFPLSSLSHNMSHNSKWKKRRVTRSLIWVVTQPQWRSIAWRLWRRPGNAWSSREANCIN